MHNWLIGTLKRIMGLSQGTEKTKGELEVSGFMDNLLVHHIVVFGMLTIAYRCSPYLCWGLHSHWFPVVGMVINPIVAVYIPIRIFY